LHGLGNVGEGGGELMGRGVRTTPEYEVSLSGPLDSGHANLRRVSAFQKGVDGGADFGRQGLAGFWPRVSSGLDHRTGALGEGSLRCVGRRGAGGLRGVA
jgi:hypothetical protein